MTRPTTKRKEDSKGRPKSAKRMGEGQHPLGIAHDRGCGGKKVVMISRGIEISITGGVEEMEDGILLQEYVHILYSLILKYQ